MSIQHSKLIEQVPSLGMQFVNDCDWLARSLAGISCQHHGDAGLDAEQLKRSVAGLQQLAATESSRQVVSLLRPQCCIFLIYATFD